MEEVAGKTGQNTDRLLGVAESNAFVHARITFHPKGTRGIPDNLISDGGIIKGAEEYKNYAPDTWRRIKEEVDELPNPRDFVENGVTINDITYKVQFFQHRNTLIDLGVPDESAEYLLKVADNVDLSETSDVAALLKLIENELGIIIEVEGIPLSTKEINELVTRLRID